MKRYGTLIALGLAVACGVLAVWLTSQWLQARASQDQAKEAVPMASIVVAAQDLEIGTTLTADNLVLASWPRANVPQGAFESMEGVVGRVAVSRLAAGEPLRAAELATEGSGVGLVALIPPGRRAMAIKVDEVSGVAGFIVPNTYVDIISVDYRNGREVREAKTILKKIKVLATAQETTNEKGKAKVVNTVTLELLPKEAETLVLHTVTGSIHLVLRNPLEPVEGEPVVEKAPAPVKRVVKARPKPATVAPPTTTAPPPPSNYSVEVIKGSKNPEKVKFKSADSDERL